MLYLLRYFFLDQFQNKLYPDLFHQNQGWVSLSDFKSDINNLSIPVPDQNEVTFFM